MKNTNQTKSISVMSKSSIVYTAVSLGAINEMMTEVTGLIIKTKGVDIRFLQWHLNFNILRKQMKYKYKRDKIPERITDLLIEIPSFNNISVCSISMPISFKEAYYDYLYGGEY